MKKVSSNEYNFSDKNANLKESFCDSEVFCLIFCLNLCRSLCLSAICCMISVVVDSNKCCMCSTCCCCGNFCDYSECACFNSVSSPTGMDAATETPKYVHSVFHFFFFLINILQSFLLYVFIYLCSREFTQCIAVRTRR